MKGTIFFILLIAGLLIISKLTVSSETYVGRVGELEMPSMFGAWLMIGYVYLLFVLFRDKNGNIGINEKEQSSDMELEIMGQAKCKVDEGIQNSPAFDKALDVRKNVTRFQPKEYREYIDNKLIKQGDPKRYLEIEFLEDNKIEIFIQFNFRQRASFVKAPDSFIIYIKGTMTITSLSLSICHMVI